MLCQCITMVHTCAVTQVCSQLHDTHQMRIVSVQSLCLLCFLSHESYFLFDCLTVCLVLDRVRAWCTLQLIQISHLVLGASHCIPCASADQRVRLHRQLDQQKTNLNRRKMFSAS